MTTTTNFKAGIDIPQWRPNSPQLGVDAAGCGLAYDMRNDSSRNPMIYHLRTGGVIDQYNPILDEWVALPGTGLNVTQNNAIVFHPSQGPRGTLAAGATSATVVLSTALIAAVGINQLSNRGDGVGFRIRIIGKSAGGSGLICERNIVGNTAGTTPTLTLDVALPFTPAAGDGYEILSGQLFMISAITQARMYDLATNSSTSPGTTNLAVGSQDGVLVSLSELHVSNDRQPSTGFLFGGSSYDPNGTGLNNALATPKNCIVATASSSTTITGSGMPTDLQTNEYVNFQCRIVEDTTNPTGAGQRAVITSHTSGATGVFTVASWPVITPSATAKFVIENNDNLILMRTSSNSPMYSYSFSGNIWSTSAFAATGFNTAVGCGGLLTQCFGIVRDPTHNRRHSHILTMRGNVSTIDLFDIANGATGTWTNAVTYGNANQLFVTGTTSAYDPVTLGGKYVHICISGTNRMARFNVLSGVLEAGTYLRYPQVSAIQGQKMAFNYMMDFSTTPPVKIAILHQKIQSGTAFFSQLIQF